MAAALSERTGMAVQLGSGFFGAFLGVPSGFPAPERVRAGGGSDAIRAAVGAVYPRSSSPKKNRTTKSRGSRGAISRPEAGTSQLAVGSLFRDLPSPSSQLPPPQRLEALRAAAAAAPVCDAPSASAGETQWTFNARSRGSLARSPEAFALEPSEGGPAVIPAFVDQWLLTSEVGQPLSWQRSVLETHWLLDTPDREQEALERGNEEAREKAGEAEAKLKRKTRRKASSKKAKKETEEVEKQELQELQELKVEEQLRVVVKGSASARARRLASRKQGSASLKAEAAGDLSNMNLKAVCTERGINPQEIDAVAAAPLTRAEGPGRAATWQAPEDSNTNQVWSFMRDIGFAKLLTKEEEVELSSTFQTAQALKDRRAKAEKSRTRELTHSEWAQLVGLSVPQLRQRLRAGERARERLIAANMRLVISVVKKYTRHGVLVSDLITAGTMGLAKGVDRFDPSRGFKLSTYVHWWIRQAVGRASAEHTGAFRLPMHVHEALAKVKRVKAELQADGQRPTTANIAESLGVSEKRIAKVQKLKLSSKSLDEAVPCPGGFSEGSSFHNFVHDPEEETKSWANVEAALLRKDMAEILLSKLDARERDIISMHFGLKSRDGQGITLDNISVRYGVSRERIRQVETVAMTKLRMLCTAKDLQRYCY